MSYRVYASRVQSAHLEHNRRVDDAHKHLMVALTRMSVIKSKVVAIPDDHPAALAARAEFKFVVAQSTFQRDQDLMKAERALRRSRAMTTAAGTVSGLALSMSWLELPL